MDLFPERRADRAKLLFALGRHAQRWGALQTAIQMSRIPALFSSMLSEAAHLSAAPIMFGGKHGRARGAVNVEPGGRQVGSDSSVNQTKKDPQASQPRGSQRPSPSTRARDHSGSGAPSSSFFSWPSSFFSSSSSMSSSPLAPSNPVAPTRLSISSGRTLLGSGSMFICLRASQP